MKIASSDENIGLLNSAAHIWSIRRIKQTSFIIEKND